MSRKRKGQCVYCGAVGQLTDDHIPPDCLFDRRPTDILEIPSCRRCNHGSSLDDEYFKTMIVLKDKAGSHPEAVLLRESVFRGLRNPRKVGFARSIVRSIRSVQLRTPAGLYVDKAPGFNVDLSRLDRVVARITRGLFWHHRKIRLPDGFAVEAYSEAGLRDMEPAHIEEMQQEVIGPVLRQPAHSIGNGVLKYWYAFATDAEHVSAWILEFYGDVRFAALTIPGVTARGDR
jgi:hypothetical protein